MNYNEKIESWIRGWDDEDPYTNYECDENNQESEEDWRYYCDYNED